MPAFQPINPRYPETNGFSLFCWENTTYSFSKDIIAPKHSIPHCFSHNNSLIVDCKGSYITDNQLIKALGQDKVSVNFCPDLYYIQLFFDSVSTAFRILEEGPYHINHETLQLHPQAHI